MNNILNIILIFIGIIIYPLATWSWNTPTYKLVDRGLQDIADLSMLFAWILSAIAVIVLLRGINNKQNNMLYWIAFSLNFVFFIVPIAFILLMMVSGIQV
jgi:uncharacterized Tic20 family protein